MTNSTQRRIFTLALLGLFGCGQPDSTSKTNTPDTSDATTDTDEPDTAPPDDTDTHDTAPPDTGDDDDTGDPPIDADADGSPAHEDCDDTEPTRYPGAPEICDDGIINDCAGTEWSAGAECASHATGADALATWSMVSSDGFSRVSAVGDVNGDGFDDIAIGVPQLSHTEHSAGGVYLFNGPMANERSPGDESQFIPGVDRWDTVGWDLVGLGDLDGDGYDDFVAGGRTTSTTRPPAHRRPT